MAEKSWLVVASCLGLALASRMFSIRSGIAFSSIVHSSDRLARMAARVGKGATVPSYVWIAIGAILGANARYYIGLWAGGRFGADFPYGTLLVNLTGSFALGFLAATTTGDLNIPADVRLLMGVGFLGSYTTFSSFSVESMALLENGNLGLGLLNIFGNNLAGLVCALLGIYLARAVG